MLRGGLAALLLVVALPAHSQSVLGCRMGLTLLKAAQGPIDVEVSSFEVRSRLAGAVAGPWRRAQQGGWQPDAVTLRMLGGARLSDTYDTETLCKDRRQFRLTCACRGGPRSGSTFRAELRVNGRAGDPQPLHRRIDLGSAC